MDKIKVNVFKPIARRAGSFASGALITFFSISSPETIQAIEAAFGALALVAVDLWASYRNRAQ